jgi:hypothetical protein
VNPVGGKEFYSVKEVAQILSLSPDRIYEYLRTGRLHGSRLAEHSAWRIPSAELERLKGLSSGKVITRSETKPGRWSDVADIAAQFQHSLSRIDPKDWAIWGIPDTGQPPLTSEAGLKIWMDRGKLVANLVVEQDHRFPLFLTRLKTSFPEFKKFNKWKNSLTEFIGLCWTVAHEIRSRAENETGLNLISIPVPGKGHLLNVPKFVYEFALDNYAGRNRPELEVLQNDPNRYKLAPKDLSDYILAIGSEAEMMRCQKATISLSDQYTNDKRIGEIRAKAVHINKGAKPFLTALSEVLEESTGDS